MAVRMAPADELPHKLSRDELEEAYMRTREENRALKVAAREQEDKMRRMATKLLRLTADLKRREGDGAHPRGGVTMKDLRAGEEADELRQKVAELTRQNENLKGKLLLAREQAGAATSVAKRKPLGVRAQPSQPHSPAMSAGATAAASERVAALEASNSQHRAALVSLRDQLERQRAEHEALMRDRVAKMRNEFDVELRVQLSRQRAEFDAELQSLTEGLTGAQQHDIELIRLQRDLKDKSSRLQALTDRYAAAEGELAALRETHAQLMDQCDRLSEELRGERVVRATLEAHAKYQKQSEKSTAELNEIIKDLRAEKALLEQENDRLSRTVLDDARERSHKDAEAKLRQKIASLEATIRSDLADKQSLLDRLEEEKTASERLRTEKKEVTIAHLELKQQHETLMEKVRFITRESAVDFDEVEEALAIVRARKDRAATKLPFLHPVDDRPADPMRELEQLRDSHAGTARELENTRRLLSIQIGLVKTYKEDKEEAAATLQRTIAEYERRLSEQARLLDTRAARIKKLEAQLKDVAYGTRQYSVTRGAVGADEDDSLAAVSINDDNADTVSTVELERGQNLFEIHVGRVAMSLASLQSLGIVHSSSEAGTMATFVTYDFFEFETQTTPVVVGLAPDFNFTSQYVVEVDDFFLRHLQKEPMGFDLHTAYGADYRTVGTCQVSFRDILERQGRLTFTAQFVSIDDPTVVVGTLEYWVRMCLPMDQALRLFKERTKALGYIDPSQARGAASTLGLAPPQQEARQLYVSVLQCRGLRARRDGMQPAPYVVYKVFDHPDHDTAIVRNSNDPVFDDVQSFSVPRSEDAEHWLRQETVDFYVFDDSDPQRDYYLGMASIVLAPLADNGEVSGEFPLAGPDGRINGTVVLSLSWQHSPGVVPELVAQRRVEKPVPVSAKPFAAPDARLAVPVAAAPKSTAPAAPAAPPAPMSLRPEPTIEDDHSEVSEASWRGRPHTSEDDDADKYGATDDEGSDGSFGVGGHAIGSESDAGSIVSDVSVPQQPPPRAKPAPAMSKPAKRPLPQSASVFVGIDRLEFDPKSSAAKDKNVRQVFVDYHFLDFPSDGTMETVSCAVRAGGMIFGYYQELVLDEHKLELLGSILRSDGEGAADVTFTVVSEPPEDDENGDCSDIGHAIVSLSDIVRTKSDFDGPAALVSADGRERIGTLWLTFKALDVLTAILG